MIKCLPKKVVGLLLVVCILSACSQSEDVSNSGTSSIKPRLIVRSSEIDSRFGLLKVKWSPANRNQLFFQGAKGGYSFPLYRYDISSTQITPLVEDGKSISGYEPSLSPDGKRLALVGFDSGEIQIVRLNGLPYTEALLPVEGSAAWSPDGQQIAIIDLKNGRLKLHLFDTISFKNNTVFEIAPENLRAKGVGGIAWSPDGKQIAFSMTRESNVEGGLQGDIFLFSPDSKSLHQVTATPSLNEDEPAWSPNSQLLAYSVSSVDPHANWQIVIANPDGSCPRIVQSVFDVRSPSWSPDGTQIAVTSFEGDAYIFDLDSLGKEFADGKLRCN